MQKEYLFISGSQNCSHGKGAELFLRSGAAGGEHDGNSRTHYYTGQSGIEVHEPALYQHISAMDIMGHEYIKISAVRAIEMFDSCIVFGVQCKI